MQDDQQSSNCSCSSSQVLKMTTLYMDKVSLPLVGVIGLAGNVAAIVIIFKKDRRSTFHHSLITLAIIDILFVSTIICDTFCDTTSTLYIYMFPYLWNPMKNILMSWETFLMMSIAICNREVPCSVTKIVTRTFTNTRNVTYQLIDFEITSLRFE